MDYRASQTMTTQTTHPIETTQQTIAANITHLLRVLQVKQFNDLDQEYRQANLQELEAVIRSPHASAESKRQLLAFAETLLKSKNVNRDAKNAIVWLLEELQDGHGIGGVTGEIDRILDRWNEPPL